MPELVSGAHRQVTAASRFGPLSSKTSLSTDAPSTTTSTTNAPTTTLIYGSPVSDYSSDDDLPSPPPSYHTVYPPSPPSSFELSPSLALNSAGKSYVNPLHRALSSPSTPLKPSLSPRSSYDNAAPALLRAVFASSSPIHHLPATPVSLDDLVPTWSGAVLDHADAGTRTLYVSGGSYADVNLRETICGVLEKAEEDLGCSGVVMCLRKDTPDLGDLLHSLMYVGGTITTLPFKARDEFVLVGLDL